MKSSMTRIVEIMNQQNQQQILFKISFLAFASKNLGKNLATVGIKNSKVSSFKQIYGNIFEAACV